MTGLLSFQSVSLWEIVGQVVFHGTVLALLTWLLCATCFRRTRPAFHSALWTVVLAKFLLPPVLPWDFSLSGWLGQAVGLVETTPSATHSAEASTVVWTEPTTVMAAPAWGGTDLLQAGLVVVYLGGLLFVVVRAALSMLRTHRTVSRLNFAGPRLRAQVGRLGGQLQLRRIPRVKMTHQSVSPFVIGWLRPTLVLPSAILGRLAPAAREALIIHELAHVRRGDTIVRAMQNTARLLLYFWPPVWWVCRRIERFSEMACDQWALKISGIDPHQYAESLLEVVRCIAAPRPAAGPELAFARKGRLLEERFHMLLDRENRVSPKLSLLMVPALAAWIPFALAGGSAPQEKNSETKQKAIRIEATTEARELPASLLERYPEADANGDGVLTGDELKEHLGIEGKLVLVERLHGGEDGEGTFEVLTGHRTMLHSEGENVFVVNTENPAELTTWEFAFASDGEHLGSLLEKHPEADLDGDGDLSKEELREFMAERIKVRGDHHGNPMSMDDSSQPNVFFVERVGEHEGSVHVSIAGAEGEEPGHYVMRSGGTLVRLREAGTDLDENGDGELSSEEVAHLKIQVRDRLMAGSGEHTQASTWVSDEGGHFVLEVSSDGKMPEGLDVNGDGNVTKEEAQAFFAERRSNTFGVKLHKVKEGDLDGDGVLSEDESLALDEKRAEARRQRFLKTHPEADQNGDGYISREEAQALAARLAKAKGQKEEDPR